ncbi:MAG: EAL domain-containing protein, partial [Treponema sp.]|nr:EAL domain-containing protein [Treponema sp.]
NTNLLPSDCVFLNKKVSYWDNYRLVLIPFFIIIISSGAVLFIIIISYIQTNSFSKALSHSKNEIAFIADHDFLTRLPNRQLANKVLKSLIKSGKDFSLMLIDVDDFKSINDFFSHLCGDSVLRTIAARLNSLMKGGEFFASRFGGDEFILAYTCGHLDSSSKQLNSLRKLLNMPFEYNDKRLFVHTSIGIANSYEGVDLDMLMANADVALYDAKSSGKNKISFFTEEMQESIFRNEKIARLLENACKYDGFTILYQPLINAKNNKVDGYEALIRLSVMNISPNMFLPIAEDRGMMVQIGRIVTEKVVKQIAQWKSEGIELHRVAINYSSGQLADVDYVRFLKKLLDDYGVSPNYIEIEITESLFMKNRQYANNLFKELSDIGVRLSLDDFGTGYSSLSCLTYLPVETVKIDKSIIDEYLKDEKQSVFVKNIVNLVHSLNMKLTVEGVEEKWQFEKLKEYQCDSVQGYYFSKPVKAVEMNTENESCIE